MGGGGLWGWGEGQREERERTVLFWEATRYEGPVLARTLSETTRLSSALTTLAEAGCLP